MGATSVTGVSGIGAADVPGAGNKGSERMSLAVHRLIGPRVVMAGVVTLSGGQASVYYPTLPGVVGQYSVQLTQSSTSVAWVYGFTTSQLTAKGGSTDTVYWTIVKNGIWGSDASTTGQGLALANT